MDRHIVTFDVNVYLDVADLVGEPFQWDRFTELAILHARAPLPHPTDNRVDALRAIAVSRSGRFINPTPLEVWTSDHIDSLVVKKAQSKLGWTAQTSQDLLEDLVHDLVYDMSKGGSMGLVQRAEGSPPLDHEDGLVWATALTSPTDPEGDFFYRYCVTGDHQFRDSGPELSKEANLLFPHEWVSFIQKVRARAAEGNMR